jgi:hypothetical protein
MPPKPPVADVFRVAVRTNRTGRDQINVFHLHGLLRAGFFGFDTADAQSVADGVFSAFHDTLLPQLTTDTTLIDCSVVDLTNITGVVGVHTGSGTGGLAGTAMPSNVSLCVSWKEALHYRGGHPRSYLGGVSATFLADVRHVTSSFAGIMTTAALAFRTQVNTLTSTAASAYTLSGVHYRIGGAVHTPPLVVPISAVAVNTRLDSQRRRLGK